MHIPQTCSGSISGGKNSCLILRGGHACDLHGRRLKVGTRALHQELR